MNPVRSLLISIPNVDSTTAVWDNLWDTIRLFTEIVEAIPEVLKMSTSQIT
jgi:hypothetical protein